MPEPLDAALVELDADAGLALSRRANHRHGADSLYAIRPGDPAAEHWTYVARCPRCGARRSTARRPS